MRSIYSHNCSNLYVPLQFASRKFVGTTRVMARPKGGRNPPAQKKPQLTHFLCLPLVNAASKDELTKSLQAFRSQVCPTEEVDATATSESSRSSAEQSIPIIPSKAVRPVGALHCTLGVMSLNSEQLQQAVEYLQSLNVPSILKEIAASASQSSDSQNRGMDSVDQTPKKSGEVVAPPQPSKVNLKGLVSMHSKQSTSILYSAPEDPSGRLYPLCVALQKRFADAGFLVEDNRELKLHATIVNTIYAKGRKLLPINSRCAHSGPSSAGFTGTPASNQSQDDRSQGHGPNARGSVRIDATGILEHFKDFKWAEDVHLDRIAICEMGAKKTFGEGGNVVDESYTEVVHLPLPE